MRNLVLLFLRFGHIILFFILEIFCLFLIVTYNQKQKEIWANSSNIFMGHISEKWNDWTNYLSLSDKMDLLAEENAKLKEKLINYGLRPTIDKDSITIAHQRYEIIPAKIIKTSIDRAYNHVVLDKGKKDGIRPGMGVISDKGVIGIIKYVSDDFAGANSLLHRRTFISSAIKRTGAFGELKWMGTNPKYVNLTAIENHHTVLEGDTIITSAFSTHFPPNIMIGTVHETHVPDGSNFHHIDVSLDNDFSVLSHVYIIKNFKQQQQLDLEKEVSDE